MKLVFRPRLVPTVCTLILAPVLAALGMWQLDRAQEKTDILNRFQAGLLAPPIDPTFDSFSLESIEFRQVQVTGTWDDNYQFLLDNRVLHGQPGYYVITPLALKHNNQAILINRGWIPASPDRSQLPKLEPISGQSTVNGIAVVPPKDVFLLKEQKPIEGDWELIWQALDILRFEQAAPYMIFDFVVQMNAEHEAGFNRQWPAPKDDWIIRHQAYAFQWFALCGTLLVIYFLFTFRPTHKSKSQQR